MSAESRPCMKCRSMIYGFVHTIKGSRAVYSMMVPGVIVGVPGPDGGYVCFPSCDVALNDSKMKAGGD